MARFLAKRRQESAPAGTNGGESKPGRRWSPLNGHEQLVVGVTPCGEGAYRVCTLVSSGESVVAVRDVREIGAGEESQTVDSTYRIPSGTPVVLALPRWEVFVGTVCLPTAEPAQIARMLPFEEAAMLPWPREEAEVAYEVQASDRDGFSTVMLFAARKESVAKHLEELREMGISPTRIEVSVLSLARLLRGIEGGKRPAILVAGFNGLEYLRLAHGHPEFSRGTAGDECPVEMLRQSLHADTLRNGAGEACTSLLIGGDKELGPGALASCSPGTGPVTSVTDMDFPLLNGAGPLQTEAVVSVAAGLGGMTASATSNLLPSREARMLTLREVFRQGKLLAIGLAWLALVLFGIGYSSFSYASARADRAEREISALKDEVGDLEKQNEALKLLAKEHGRVGTPLRFVLELYRLTPQPIAITSLRYDTRGILVFDGEAPSFPHVYEYVDTLLGSTLFEDVEMRSSTKPRGSGQRLVDFKVTCTILGGT